jgi:predicted Zn-dependent protease
MSSKRAALEIGLVLGVLGGLVLGVLWMARHAAELFTDHVPIEVDRTLGEQSSRVMSIGATPCTDPAAEQYVKQIAAPLVAALGKSRFEYSFVVVDTPEVNAFALPGGFVTVNSGLLESAETADEIAAVLAHEIFHVERRHGTQRMLRELGASVVLSAIFGGTNVALPAQTAHDLVSNAYDRDQEAEADRLGLELMVKAGLDPMGMSRFFDRLAKSAVTPPAILSTHPDPGDRAEAAAAFARGSTASTKLPSPKGVRCRR